MSYRIKKKQLKSCIFFCSNEFYWIAFIEKTITVLMVTMYCVLSLVYDTSNNDEFYNSKYLIW